MKFNKKIVLPVSTLKDMKADTPSPKISTKIKCINCSKYMEPDDTSKCQYHSGKLRTDGLRTSNSYDESVYECCGKVRIGFNPILEEPAGCVVAPSHIFIRDS